MMRKLKDRPFVWHAAHFKGKTCGCGKRSTRTGVTMSEKIVFLCGYCARYRKGIKGVQVL